MLPQFPLFKKLELSDQKNFEEVTLKYPPYSDFNFASLTSYDYGTNEWTYLNDNLVIRFPDYITNQPIYSFLGKNKITNTIDSLFEFITQNGLKLELQLIPEDSIADELELLVKKYNIMEDRNGFDYILSNSKIAALAGRGFQRQRNMIYKFNKTVSNYSLALLNLQDNQTQKQILDLTLLWANKKEKTNEEAEHEKKATENLLKNSHLFNLVSIGVYTDQRLIAFFISELLDKSYAIGHFRKADTGYPGIFRYTDHKMAVVLHDYGCEYFNFEQDLGLETLRQAKMSWKPIYFLKKYIIQPI